MASIDALARAVNDTIALHFSDRPVDVGEVRKALTVVLGVYIGSIRSPDVRAGHEIIAMRDFFKGSNAQAERDARKMARSGDGQVSS